MLEDWVKGKNQAFCQSAELRWQNNVEKNAQQIETKYHIIVRNYI